MRSEQRDRIVGKAHHKRNRLRFQYELTKTNLNGHLLDPSVPLVEPGMLVADVATGTGTWALDLAERVPSSVGIEGLDINLETTPPKVWLPPNVAFTQFNMLENVPEELIEPYDIVHVEYVMIFVLDPNFKQVLNRLVRLLSMSCHS